jgi:ribonuclease HI
LPGIIRAFLIFRTTKEEGIPIKKKPITVYCDGLCEPNPGGVATCGWVAYRGDKRIKKHHTFVFCGPGATNNIAEYNAVLSALEWLLQHGHNDRDITIKTDSQLVVNQINGSYSVKAVNLIPLHKKAVNLAKEFDNISFQWIPRKRNKEADELSRQAYRKFLSERPKSREEKAKEIIGNVTHLHRNLYIVRSQTDVSTLYLVDISKNQCNCPDFENRRLICKHILAAKLFDKKRKVIDHVV